MLVSRFSTFLFACVAAFAVSNANATLIGHWTFDEPSGDTAFDVSGSANTYDAEWQGDPGANIRTTGILGRASQQSDEDADGTSPDEFYLFGAGGVSELPASDAMTISIWFQLTSEANDNSIINGLFGNRDNIAVFEGNGANFGPDRSLGAIALESNSAPWNIEARIGNDALNGPSDISETDFDWHHAALVWSNGPVTTGNTADIQELYIDGALATTTGSIRGWDLTSIANFTIGTDGLRQTTREFTGLLDDAGLWDEALTATQIATIYSNGLQGINLANQPNAPIIPEPASLALGLLSLMGLVGIRRR